jgi:hypothetical protein
MLVALSRGGRDQTDGEAAWQLQQSAKAANRRMRGVIVSLSALPAARPRFLELCRGFFGKLGGQFLKQGSDLCLPAVILQEDQRVQNLATSRTAARAVAQRQQGVAQGRDDGGCKLFAAA